VFEERSGDLRAVIHGDKDNREEDNFADDQQHDGSASPLQLNDAFDSAVCLSGRCGGETSGISGQIGTGVGCGPVVQQALDVDMDAVSRRDEL